MPIRTPTKRRLGALATACLLSIALPAAPAWAQKTKTKPAPVAEATLRAPSEVNVSIPSIEAIDSNVDEAVLRDIFSGNLVDNADALAGLTATSITIPAITITATGAVEGSATEGTVTLADIVLNDVANGVADTITVSGFSLATNQDASGEFGAISAHDFDIGGMLRLYGLVDGAGQTELTTIYTDLSFAGGSFSAPDISCTFGATTAAEFKARPIKTSFAELMALGQALEDQSDEPSPELLGQALHAYVDMFTAVDSSPVHFDGFECSGTDDDDNPVDVTMASMTMGGMSPGVYPAVEVSDLNFVVDGDGSITIGKLNFKPIDFSAPIAAINAAPAALDDAWFTANARALVPAFAGFSLADLAVDIPDPDSAGDRIVAGVGSFDITLADYRNGIPSALTTSASNVVLELPATSSDEQLQMLMALGVSSIDAGFTIDTSWDETTNAITIKEISVTGADLATVRLAATINNATEALFSGDEDTMLVAAMGLAIGDLKIDINDDGLSDLIMTMVAADQGADAATLRPVFAGLAEGTIVGVLAGAAEGQKVAGAVSAFVAGKASNLSFTMTAKQPPGLGMMAFMDAEDDPTILLNKVTIGASN